MNRADKIEIIKHLKAGLITPGEAKANQIILIDLGDGRYQRESTGEVYTSLTVLKIYPVVKMELRVDDKVLLTFFTFLDLLKLATAATEDQKNS